MAKHMKQTRLEITCMVQRQMLNHLMDVFMAFLETTKQMKAMKLTQASDSHTPILSNAQLMKPIQTTNASVMDKYTMDHCTAMINLGDH